MSKPWRLRLVLLAAVLLAGCGAQAHGHAGAARAAVVAPIAPKGATCTDVIANTLAAVARRIYGQAAHGRNVVAARRRLARSRPLAAAVAAGDPRATRAALVPLLKHQIRRIVITRGPHTLATIRGGPALAPVRGVLHDAAGHPVGRYLLSVSDASAVTRITQSLTGATVTLRARGGGAASARATGSAGAGATVAASAGAGGAVERRVAFGVRAFPDVALTETLAIPRSSLASAECGATPRQTVAGTIGAIGRRLFATESHGPSVARVLRHVVRDAGFRAAVAGDDPVALRAAIIRFFRTRSLHVVRVRATTTDGRLVGDVGGPDVLAPASATVRDAGGRAIGTVTLAVQDDTGYIKLMHRFTGAAVLLRTPTAQIAGSTLEPGPRAIPPSGALSYAGHRYDATTFTAQAFPSGPLTISLLI